MRRIIKTFKKYFIPHEENDHKPHLLRPRAIVFVILIAFAVEAVFLFGSPLISRSRLFGVIMTNALTEGTNSARIADNLLPLRENPLLDAAAQEKADDMAARGYFAHTSPAGLTPWYWFQKVGYDFSAAGENLAVNFSDSQDVTNAWLNSPEHRANILNAGFTEIGMATARGNFEGNNAVYVVELFGTPALSRAAAPVAAAPVAAAPVVAARTPIVAVNTQPVKQKAFAAVKGAESPAVSVTAAAAPASAPAPQGAQTSIVQGMIADPRRAVDYFYFAIILLFAFALLLNVFMKIHIQHPQAILGGMLVILVAGLFIVLNQHLGAASIAIL